MWLKPLVSSGGTFPGSQPQAPASPNLPARPPPPPPPRRPSPPRQGPVSSGRRECYFDTAAPDACDNILARNVTWQECCCTVGEGWGSGCRIQQCPGTETGGHGLWGDAGPWHRDGRACAVRRHRARALRQVGKGCGETQGPGTETGGHGLHGDTGPGH